MKAIVYEKYGSPDVLELREIDKPAPNDNEILLKVRAASVNPIDFHFMRGTPYFIRMMTGLIRPKITGLGVDVAGQVEAVGKNVTKFKPGDEVFGSSRRTLAEYVCTTGRAMVKKPNNITFEEAASVPLAALSALEGLSDHGKIKRGQKVLIEGASGGIGTFAIQIAKSFGAQIIAVCSTRNLEIARSLGADEIIDYTKEDFAGNKQSYDLIFAPSGYHSLSDYRRSLNPGGIFVMVGGSGALMIKLTLFGSIFSLLSGKKFTGMLTKGGEQNLEFINDLLKTGKLKPVIDRSYPLSETAEAIRYLEQGHAQGKVVITV
jgi:NADPH:quinone reductase-like Zn-dependent oxidoreductase